MSISYWVIFGLGFDSGDLIPYLDPKKLRHKLADKQIVLSKTDLTKWKKLDTDSRIAMLETYCDSSFGFMDLIAETDTKTLLSYGNDGDNGKYLYYGPTYPWQMKEYECKTEAEAREHLCDVVMPFTKRGTTRSAILALVYEINQVGSG